MIIRPNQVSVLPLVLLIACLIPTKISAQEPTRVRRALLICGLTGNDELKEQFVDSMTQIQKALVGRCGFDESNVSIQFGRNEEEPVEPAFPSAGRATREEIATEVKRLSQQTRETDTTWVFVIGHAYFDGRTSFFNIPDRDFTHQQIGKLFAKLKGQSTFFICTPASGFYVKELSKPNRVIVTATDADAETNGSLFHVALAKALTDAVSGSSSSSDADVDKNGIVSLFDLYIKANQNLSDLYLTNDPPLLVTEHPQLDDNGDARGSELQIDYLTIAQGGRSDAKRKRNIRKFQDGKIAARLPLVATSR